MKIDLVVGLVCKPNATSAKSSQKGSQPAAPDLPRKANALLYRDIRKPTSAMTARRNLKIDCAATENARPRTPGYSKSKSKPPSPLRMSFVIDDLEDSIPSKCEKVVPSQHVLREIDLNEPVPIVLPPRSFQRSKSFVSSEEATRRLEDTSTELRDCPAPVAFPRLKDEGTDPSFGPKPSPTPQGRLEGSPIEIYSRPSSGLKDEDTGMLFGPKLAPTSPIVFDTAGFIGALSTAVTTKCSLETICAPENRWMLSVGVISRHIEVWDLDVNDMVAWPACVRLTDSLPSSHLSQPPVDFIDIECRTVSHGRRSSGSKLDYSTCNSPRSLSGSSCGASDNPNHIHIHGGWQVVDNNAKGTMSGRAWTLGCWVSVPVQLFARSETRMFKIQVRAMLGGVKKSMIVSDACVVSVSHLRMGKR
ncbi:hypothetical protein OE88DRAFT_1738773 [Heliocybe sulcata]|uniref:Uncharacterized protein n=1 Tax=Heliocybe sulcata TaxID=5364 RepID=A0A5C3MNV7_9AGAM|nr:hypothetical protein OE88DRAFT_1738773 [Heliocybe sulcata]